MSEPSMMDVRLSIARDFSKFPGGRFRADGEWSGEEFRDDKLVPLLQRAIEQGAALVVTLDDAVGYPSSFLEEAFGGLVRERHFSKEELARHLKIEAGPLFTRYKLIAEKCIRDARPMVAA